MVYVDNLFFWPNTVCLLKKRKLWCHMWADNTAELHAMAKSIDVKRCWYENKRGKNFPHYDLHEDKRTLALSHGAMEMHLRDYLSRGKGHE